MLLDNGTVNVDEYNKLRKSIGWDVKEIFYEKCGFEKLPLGYIGYGMIKRIKKV